MRHARSLARLNGQILHTYSQRTIAALRAILPLRLALPHLESVLALNVGKEVEKDTLVIRRAREPAGADTADRNDVLAQLLQTTKDIDRRFLARVGRFPVEIVVRYEDIAPIRARRIKLLHEAATKILAARDTQRHMGRAVHTSYSREEFAQLLYELFRLYAEETRSLSRSVRLPMPLVPLRELIGQELLNVMTRVARTLANEIAAEAFRPKSPDTPM